MIDVEDSNAVYYYHYDALGSVIALSDSDGDTVQVYEYDIYGQVAASDPDHSNPFLFTGRRYDTETGLYYFRARYYNPNMGRFLQTDPTGYDAGMNWYAYCDNNPVCWIDPLGLEEAEQKGPGLGTVSIPTGRIMILPSCMNPETTSFAGAFGELAGLIVDAAELAGLDKDLRVKYTLEYLKVIEKLTDAFEEWAKDSDIAGMKAYIELRDYNDQDCDGTVDEDGDGEPDELETPPYWIEVLGVRPPLPFTEAYEGYTPGSGYDAPRDALAAAVVGKYLYPNGPEPGSVYEDPLANEIGDVGYGKRRYHLSDELESRLATTRKIIQKVSEVKSRVEEILDPGD